MNSDVWFRSVLFVPGNRPDRIEKAAASGADAIMVDLEDAVPVADKPSARIATAAALRELACTSSRTLSWDRCG